VSFLEKEAAVLKTNLSKKETEIVETKTQLSNKEKETTDLKARLSSKEQEAIASQAMLKTQAKELASPKSEEVDSKPLENNSELHEREKESLRIQIAMLEEQLANSSKEHELALEELCLASEAELFRKGMENGLEHHMTKERDLKETLSRDEEELLENTKHLESEKKADRNEELREVQKEDLLQHIATLEKMEKDLVTDHERVLQDVRNQRDGEIQTLKEELEKQRGDANERKLQQVDKDHSIQLDELLTQLDLIEAEHGQKVLEITSEKDAIIAALGAQLTDAKTREKEVDATHEKLTVNLARVQEEASTAKENVENMKNELEYTKSAHDNLIMGEGERRERACEEAREEMIERAEIQFKAANDLYINLKKEYDSSIAEVERVESELKDVKTKLEAAKNEKEDRVADLKAEVAELKATDARTESDAAHRAKEHGREMEGLLKAAKDFEIKLEDTKSTSRSLEKSLSAVVSAKTKLQQEYDEMKSVCEELMVLVEG
jgi:hypothetical protein